MLSGFGFKAVESGRMSSSVLTSQVVVPTCPNLPHLGHTLPTFLTGFGRKNPARLPRNSAIIICIGDQVGRGPLSCPEESAARCAVFVLRVSIRVDIVGVNDLWLVHIQKTANQAIRDNALARVVIHRVVLDCKEFLLD